MNGFMTETTFVYVVVVLSWEVIECWRVELMRPTDRSVSSFERKEKKNLNENLTKK